MPLKRLQALLLHTHLRGCQVIILTANPFICLFFLVLNPNHLGFTRCMGSSFPDESEFHTWWLCVVPAFLCEGVAQALAHRQGEQDEVFLGALTGRDLIRVDGWAWPSHTSTAPIASAARDLTLHPQHPWPIGAVGGFQTLNYLSQVTYHRDTFISRSWTQPSPAGWKFN